MLRWSDVAAASDAVEELELPSTFAAVGSATEAATGATRMR
jgi:hypothetical protein